MTRDHRSGHLSTSDVTMTSHDNNNNAMATHHSWDIADNVFPIIDVPDEFVEYPMGYVKYAYSGSCAEAKTHQSGWAARNANNHNQAILKKSCLGVLLCDRQCRTDNGEDIVRVRPSICDKARKKQINTPCPTKGCSGRLRHQPCRGHGGYPVTHFWREVPDPRPGLNATTIFFQAKGDHDHPPPQRKSMPAPSHVRTRLREHRKPLTSKVRRRRLASAPRRPVKMASPASYHDVVDKKPLISSADGLSSAKAQSWTMTPACHVIPYNNNNNNNSHVTNHVSAYDRLQVLGGDCSDCCSSISETFPTAYVTDGVFSNAWNDPTIPSCRHPVYPFQPTKSLPPARQLPVSFDDVISARQRPEYCGSGGALYPAAVSDGARQLCQYGRNSVSGSFGAYQMTCDSSSSVTVYPTSSSPWLDDPQLSAYRACAEYRMSRRHVVSDVTSGQCGWTGMCDFDDMMWRGVFVEGL